MGISFKMGKGSVCGVYTSLNPMIHFDSKQSQSIFNQNYYKNVMANNCKQCSIRIISHITTPLPKAYDCVAVYIAGRRTSLGVYGWWPPTKNRPELYNCYALWKCYIWSDGRQFPTLSSCAHVLVKICNPEETCCYARSASVTINNNTGLKCYPCRGGTPSCHSQAFFTGYTDSTTFAWILDVLQLKNGLNKKLRHE